MQAIGLQAGPVPRCPGCGALLRPDIVWFGEPLDPQVFDDAWDSGGLEAGGTRIEATQGSRHAYVGVLYAASDSGLDATALVERLGEDFRLQFAVPSGSAQESETREWGYPNHIWFVQWETAQ